jgi:hypothetical protein
MAAYLLEVQTSESGNEKAKTSENDAKEPSGLKGVYVSSHSTRIAILNGSHTTLSDDPADESVLIFPDYKIVTEVPSSLDGARTLWNSCISPSLGRAGLPMEQSFLRSWVLPYSCVILLCA